MFENKRFDPIVVGFSLETRRAIGHYIIQFPNLRI